MKNINDLTNVIQFKNLFNICPELNNLSSISDINRFSNYFISYNNQIVNCTYIGNYKEYFIFIPNNDELLNLVLFNNVFQYIDSDITMYKDLYIIQLTVIYTKSLDNLIYKNICDIRDMNNYKPLIENLSSDKIRKILKTLDLYI